MGRHRRRRLRRKQFGGCRLEIYDRDDTFGIGRCMSFYVRRNELMRFDLFPGQEHWHRKAETSQPRHYYPSGLAFHDYVELALKDLASDRRITTNVIEWARTELG